MTKTCGLLKMPTLLQLQKKKTFLKEMKNYSTLPMLGFIVRCRSLSAPLLLILDQLTYSAGPSAAPAAAAGAAAGAAGAAAPPSAGSAAAAECGPGGA